MVVLSVSSAQRWLSRLIMVCLTQTSTPLFPYTTSKKSAEATNKMLVSYILYVLMFLPEGGFDREMHPVEAPACQPDSTGKIVEDSTCGIKFCLMVGKKRAAQLAGERPGVGFGIMCKKVDG